MPVRRRTAEETQEGVRLNELERPLHRHLAEQGDYEANQVLLWLDAYYETSDRKEQEFAFRQVARWSRLCMWRVWELWESGQFGPNPYAPGRALRPKRRQVAQVTYEQARIAL